jgi:hypothetical protein
MGASKGNFPGPGNYALPGITGNEGGSKTMHSVIEYDPLKKEHSYKPGPGNYNPDVSKVKKNDPAFKLGSSTRLDLEFETKRKF